MKTQEFVKTLSKIPSDERIESLKGLGLPEDFILEYVKSYQFTKLIHNKDSHDDPIIDLVRNYNGSTVKIGMITFDIVPEANKEYFFFGRFESDILAIQKKSKEIHLLDIEDLGHRIFYCSVNSSAFLDALVLAASFLERLPHDDGLLENQVAICEVALECSILSGGSKYLNFYKTLLGCNV